MRWSFAIHLIGTVLWLGGLLVLTRFARVAAEPGTPPSPRFVETFRKSWFIYVLHGLALSLLTGVYQLIAGGGPGYYFKQGWFHGKIALVLVLLAATVMLGMEVRKIGEGQLASPGRLRLIQILSISALIGIVVLTKVFRP